MKLTYYVSSIVRRKRNNFAFDYYSCGETVWCDKQYNYENVCECNACIMKWQIFTVNGNCRSDFVKHTY